MVETFYVHLEFGGKNGWSINLPFLCTKCSVCCTLEDFLTAGKLAGKPEEHPEIYAKMKCLYEELGNLWAADEAKYDAYTMHTPCPFLVNNSCSIYEIRPDGCRLFPNTAYGMQTTNCEPLIRFKKQCLTLKRGRRCKETYHHTQSEQSAAESVKRAKFTEKQYQACIAKLRQTGVTDDELALLNYFNGQNR